MNRSEKRKEKYETIRRMMDAGANIEEMMEATGYTRSAANTAIRKIREEDLKEDNEIIFVEKKKPVFETVIIEGKRYLDITEAFLTTDWEVSEVGV